MSSVYEEVVSANKNYAANFGDLSNLSLPPARKFAVLTCMDARLDPAKVLYLLFYYITYKIVRWIK